MRPETLEQLRKISQTKQFHIEDAICQEGHPGNEMYIILKGSVGVFVTNAIGMLNQVATIGVGDFFGEMAIFDDFPRSATCIALEDTIVVAVTKDNLEEFLERCPEIAGQMLERMSGRIRKLDDELYRNNRFVKNRHVPKFMIPVEFREGHSVRAKKPKEELLIQYKQACPICGKAVSVTDIRRNRLTEKNFEVDCRMTYEECSPLWYEVISCPNCYYANHYLHFFGVNNFEYEVVSDLLRKEHRTVVESGIARRGDLDFLVMHYLQAININEHINAGADALIGGLWRSLYWISKDINDLEFAAYCAKRAVAKYKKALDEDVISDELNKTSTAMSLVNMMVFLKDNEEILKYVGIATQSSDIRIRNNATLMKEKLERIASNKE